MSAHLTRIAKVAGSTALSRVLGLVREMLAARMLGAGAMNSAFLTAFTVPNLFRRFLGEGALTGALIPVLTERHQKEGREGVFRTVNEVFTWLLVVSALLVLASWAIAGSGLLLPGIEDRFRDGLQFTIALMPFLAFVCGAAALAACLQVLGNFTAPALSQIWLNVCMIVSLNVFGAFFSETEKGKVWWLCGGVLAGGIMQILTPAWALWRLGWRPKWSPVRSPEVREILLLMGPGLFGAAIYQINLASSRLFAFNLDESAASYINYASRLMELPMGMFAVAVTTVVFPVLAARAAAGDGVRFGEAFRQGVRLNAIVTLPAAVGLIVLGAPIIRLLFEGGAFTPENTRECAPVLAVFAAALPFYAVTSLCTRAFHAVKDMRTPVRAAVVSLVVNLILSPILPIWFGTPGLAAASNLAMVAQAAVLAHAVRRRFPEARPGAVLPDLGKMLVASCAMGAAVAWLGPMLPWEALLTRFGAAVHVAILIPVGVGVYGMLVWALRVEGVREVRTLVLGRLKRGER